MRTPSLTKPALLFLLAVCGCARKGDPQPAPPVPPRAPEASWSGLRQVDIVLPAADLKGENLGGLEAVRILYLPLGLARPTAQEVFTRGEVVLERRRPDLPAPGGHLGMDLGNLNRPAGWIVVVAVRGGQVPSGPSPVLAWLNAAF